jgi:hypothetical protein
MLKGAATVLTMREVAASVVHYRDVLGFTVADMQREIDFVRSGGAPLPGIERFDPGKLLYKAPI